MSKGLKTKEQIESIGPIDKKITDDFDLKKICEIIDAKYEKNLK